MTVSYKDLIKLEFFDDRLELLRTGGIPSEVTFGELRLVNQRFYNSKIWKETRRAIIARDLGYDLGVPGYPIYGKAIVHHIIPITPKDLFLGRECVLNHLNLITVSHKTHQAIHYGSDPGHNFVERKPGDTKLW